MAELTQTQGHFETDPETQQRQTQEFEGAVRDTFKKTDGELSDCKSQIAALTARIEALEAFHP